ncbi:hypothetical protein [Actinoallomurus sp. CA-142502]|uniref:WXG100-like domain-containing protein n=1 Tax=Actinoallomurus sp. CA-142502 TaxID=3239885 RepID=UPI003D91257E
MAGGRSTDTHVSHNINDDVNSQIPALPDPAGYSTKDVQPAWETEALPDWVVYWLIPMLTSGQTWPKASESKLWELRLAFEEMVKVGAAAFEPAGTSVRTISTGYEAVSAIMAKARVSELFGDQAGMLEKMVSAFLYSRQTDSFAQNTQYSKISCNVAFWVAVTAAFIALIAAYFTAGTTVSLIGPYAQAGRTAMARILERLGIAAGRSFGANGAARITALAGNSAAGRFVSHALMHELIEELGEEGFTDAYSQYLQMKQGTRRNFDWHMAAATAIGAGTGAFVGMKLHGPVSGIADNLPGIRTLNRIAGDAPGVGNAFRRFPGRAMNTGLNNVAASPAGSFLANGLVYGQWEAPTGESMLGGFMGGVGRTNTISPFNPGVFHAVTSPGVSLAGAFHTSMASDAAHLGINLTGGPDSPDGPKPDSQQPQNGQNGTAPVGTSPVASNAPTGDVNGQTVNGQAANGTRAAGAGNTRVNAAANVNADPDNSGDPAAPHDSTLQNAAPQNAVAPDPTAANVDPNAVQQGDQSVPVNTDTSQGTGPTQPDGTANPPATSNPTAPAPATATGQNTSLDGTAPATSPVNGSQTTPVNGSPTAPVDGSPTGPVAGSGDTGTGQPGSSPSNPNSTRPDDAVVGALVNHWIGRSDGTPNANQNGNAQTGNTQTGNADTQTPAPHHGRQNDFGLVAAGRLKGTAFVANGRQGPIILSLAEAHALFDADLRPTDFGPQVRGWNWSADGTTLIIHFQDHLNRAPQHFRFKVENKAEGRRDRARSVTPAGVRHPRLGLRGRRLGRTRVRSGTVADPHAVTLAPGLASGQVARVMLHEISDTFQRQTADQARSGQGAIRRFLSRLAERRDGCLSARLNEHWYLSRKWHAAATDAERQAYAREIEGVARYLRKHGHTPPTPPWSGEGRPTTGPNADLSDLRANLNGAVTDTAQAVAGLRQAIADQLAALDQTDDELHRLTMENYDAAFRLGQQAADAIARGDLGHARELREASLRHYQAAEKFSDMRGPATQVHDAYRRAAGLADEMANGGQVDVDDLAAAVQDADRQHEQYQRGLANAGQSRPSGDPTAPGRRHAELAEQLIARAAAATDLRQGLERQAASAAQAAADQHRVAEYHRRAANQAFDRAQQLAAGGQAQLAQQYHDAGTGLNREASAYDEASRLAGQAAAAYREAASQLEQLMIGGPVDLTRLGQNLDQAQAHHAGYQDVIADRPVPAHIAQAIREAENTPEPPRPEVTDLRAGLAASITVSGRTAMALQQEIGGQLATLDQAADELQRLATENYDASLRLLAEAGDAIDNGDLNRARELRLAAQRHRQAGDAYSDMRIPAVQARAAYREVVEQLTRLANDRGVRLGDLAQAVQDAQNHHYAYQRGLAAAGQSHPSGDPTATIRLHAALQSQLAERNRLGAELAVELQRQIGALNEAGEELHRLVMQKYEFAVRLSGQARDAFQAGDLEGGSELRAASLRQRKAGDAYDDMRIPVMQARNAYQKAVTQLNAMVSGTDFQRGGLAQDLEEGRKHQVAYREALDEGTVPDGSVTVLQEAASRLATDTRPPDAAMPAAAAAGNLPVGHLTRLVNQVLSRVGIDHRFTVEDLDRTLRGDFRRLVSEDGAILPVGDGEIRVKLRVPNLRMVTDTDVEASETMVGTLPQGGASVASAANRSTDLSASLDAGALAKLTPWEWARTVAQFAILKGGGGYTWSSSDTHHASEFALGGAVEDDRSPHTMFETPWSEGQAAGNAVFEVQVRRTADGPGHGWSNTQSVSTDGPVRVWVSHTYTDSAPAEKAQLPVADRQQTALPESSVTGMTGLDELTDRTADEMGLDPNLDDVARRQVRTLFNDELPSRLGEAVDDPHGLQRTIVKDGKEIGTVQIKSEIVLEPDEDPRVGPASNKRWLERLRITFSGASRESSKGRARHFNVTGGVQVGPDHLGALNEVGGVTPKLSGTYARTRSRSRSTSSGGTSIHPSVQRWKGHTQGYHLRVKHTVTIHMAGERRARPAIDGESKALFRMPEPLAFRYGLPVDPAAIVRDDSGAIKYNPDGTVRLRDDPDPDPPKGRKGELPKVFGKNKLRGAGPALVQDVTGVDKLREQVEERLRKLGLLPKIKNGQKVYSRDPVKRASQMANEREVDEQFTMRVGRNGKATGPRFESGYDQLAQEGLHLDLMHAKTGHSPKNFTLRVKLEQDFEHAKFKGVSDAESVVNLDIGSDTTSMTESQSTTNSGTGAAAVDAPKGPGLTPSGGEIDVGYNSTEGASTAEGDTANQVIMGENVGPVAVFEIPHKLRVDLLTAKGKAITIAEDVDGSARVVLPADMLPSSENHPAAPAHPTSGEARRTAKLLHADAGDEFLKKAVKLLGIKVNSPEFHELAAALNVRGLLSHPEWMYSSYHTGQATVTAELGDSEFVEESHIVDGDINLTLASHAVGHNESHGWTVKGSGGVGVNTSTDPNGNAGVSLSRSSSRSRSRTETDIWGTEQLAIDTGKKYVFQAHAKFRVSTAPDAKGHTRSDSAEGGSVLYTLAERDALSMWARGEVSLPLHQVAKAMERLLRGELRLDRRTAVPFARKYLGELALARYKVSLDERRGQPVGVPALPVTKGHSRETITNLLTQFFPSDVVPRADAPSRRMANMLAEVRRLELHPDTMVIPDHYRKDVGISTFQRTSLHTAEAPDTEVEVVDQVAAAVNAVAPRALADNPALWRALYVDFAGKRWWGKMRNMLSPAGYTKNFGDFTVRVTASFDGDPTLLRHMYSHGQILQHYTYEQEDVSESKNVTYEGSVSGGAAKKGVPTPFGNVDGSVHGTVKTHRSHTSSGGHTRQKTRLQGEGVFRDAEPVIQHGLTLKIEVVRNSVDIRAALEGARRRHEVTLTGTAERVLPAGMAAPVGKASASPVGPADARRLVPPAKSSPEHVEIDDLPKAIIDGLVRHKVISRSEARAHEASIRRVTTGDSLTARFERATDANGHRMITLQLGNNKVVEVWVRHNMSEPKRSATGLIETELRDVNRQQEQAKVEADRSHLGPATVSFGGGPDTFGVGADATFGAQSTEHRSVSGGNRNETSAFEKGSADKVQFRVDSDITFVEKKITSVDEVEVIGEPVRIAHAATGSATLTLFGHQLDEMLSRAEVGAPDRPAWHSGESAKPGRRRPYDVQKLMDQAAKRPDFDPAEPHHAMAEILKAGGARRGVSVRLRAHFDRGAPNAQMNQARLLARALNTEVHLDIRNTDGSVTSYSATFDGDLHMAADEGFAEQFNNLPNDLIVQADRFGRDLYELYLRTRTQPGTFAEKVRDELRRLAIPGHVADQPSWPTQAPPDESEWHGQSYMGGVTTA